MARRAVVASGQGRRMRRSSRARPGCAHWRTYRRPRVSRPRRRLAGHPHADRMRSSARITGRRSCPRRLLGESGRLGGDVVVEPVDALAERDELGLQPGKAAVSRPSTWPSSRSSSRQTASRRAAAAASRGSAGVRWVRSAQRRSTPRDSHSRLPGQFRGVRGTREPSLSRVVTRSRGQGRGRAGRDG